MYTLPFYKNNEGEDTSIRPLGCELVAPGATAFADAHLDAPFRRFHGVFLLSFQITTDLHYPILF
jgi:hypothetical protein